ncbi:MAG TPA: glycosyl hydrolase family 28-related protein, partial [Armatimonadota bacterium]
MPKVLVVSLLALFALCPLWAQAAQLPELNWEKRSDWLDPTTDTTPRAVGNGVADDTAALQAALDRISNESKTNKVVFLPKGIYRITKTLVISNTSQGAEVIGCGRNTRIVWDGEDNGIML